MYRDPSIYLYARRGGRPPSAHYRSEQTKDALLIAADFSEPAVEVDHSKDCSRLKSQCGVSWTHQWNAARYGDWGHLAIPPVPETTQESSRKKAAVKNPRRDVSPEFRATRPPRLTCLHEDIITGVHRRVTEDMSVLAHAARHGPGAIASTACRKTMDVSAWFTLPPSAGASPEVLHLRQEALQWAAEGVPGDLFSRSVTSASSLTGLLSPPVAPIVELHRVASLVVANPMPPAASPMAAPTSTGDESSRDRIAMNSTVQ